jgi:hypothetical protein
MMTRCSFIQAILLLTLGLTAPARAERPECKALARPAVQTPSLLEEVKEVTIQIENAGEAGWPNDVIRIKRSGNFILQTDRVHGDVRVPRFDVKVTQWVPTGYFVRGKMKYRKETETFSNVIDVSGDHELVVVLAEPPVPGGTSILSIELDLKRVEEIDGRRNYVARVYAKGGAFPAAKRSPFYGHGAARIKR